MDNLKDTLILINFAVRHSLGAPASFGPEESQKKRSGEALVNLLTTFKAQLISAVSTESRKYGLTVPSSRDILNSAYLYSTQPPIVKDINKSRRKVRLRLEDLLDWLNETNPSTESFEKRFRTWANIFATEYCKLRKWQKTDTPVFEWTQEEILESIRSEEDYDLAIENIPDTKSLPEHCDEHEYFDSSSQKMSEYLFAYLLQCFSGSDSKCKVTALFILLRYLTFEQFSSFHELNEILIKNCTKWTGKSESDIRSLLASECSKLRPRKDLMRRRVARDLPKLEYEFVLPLIGEDITEIERYYTAICRFTKILNAERKLRMSHDKTTRDV